VLLVVVVSVMVLPSSGLAAVVEMLVMAVQHHQ
jgi:hypothetical protein